MITHSNVRVPDNFYRKKNVDGSYDYYTGPVAPFPAATGLNLTSLRSGIAAYHMVGIEKVNHWKYGHLASEETPIIDISWNKTFNMYIVILRDRYIGDRAVIMDGGVASSHEFIRTTALSLYNRVKIDGLYYRPNTQEAVVREFGPRAIRGISNFKVGYAYKEVHGGKDISEQNRFSRPFILVEVGEKMFNYVPMSNTYYGQTNYIQTGYLTDHGIVPVRFDDDGIAVYNCNMTVAI